MLEVIVLIVIFSYVERLFRDEGGDVFVCLLICRRGRIWFPRLSARWRHLESDRCLLEGGRMEGQIVGQKTGDLPFKASKHVTSRQSKTWKENDI